MFWLSTILGATARVRKLKTLKVITNKEEYSKFIACVDGREKGIKEYTVFVDQEIDSIKEDSNL